MVRYSVIIPAYNRSRFLKKAVNSVLDQTYDNLELIVIDDGSTDSTDKLINEHKDRRLKYIYQENKGVSSARNQGLLHAVGEYIAFLDSDDWWLQKKLEEVENAVRKYPQYTVYHTKEQWFRKGKQLNHKKIHEKRGGNIFENCLRLCSISISTAVVKRDIFDDIGTFDEDLPVCEDYDFWLRVSSKYPVYLIDKVLTEKEGGHRDQLSSKYRGMDRFRIKSICKLLDSGSLDEQKYILAFRELKRKCYIYAQGCFKRNKTEEGNLYTGIINRYKLRIT